VKRKKARKMSSASEKRRNKQYTTAAMEAAIEDVKQHGLKPSLAARNHLVPVTTLKDRIKGIHGGKVGAKRILKDEEELALVEWIVSWAKMGQPLEKSQVLKTAGKIVKTHAPGEKKFDAEGTTLMI
jgi:hypothetical protein